MPSLFNSNNKTQKLISLGPQVLQEGNKVSTVAGTGTAGFANGQRQSAFFSEPSGLAEGPHGSLLVADTNNGLVRWIPPLCMPFVFMLCAMVWF